MAGRQAAKTRRPRRRAAQPAEGPGLVRTGLLAGLPYAGAVALAVVFAGAGVAKLARRQATSRAFTALGLASPRVLAIGVPVLELTLAVALVVVPSWAGVVSLAVLAGFTTFVVSALRRGDGVGCGCFGSAQPQPMGGPEVLRNAFLAILATLAATSSGPQLPSQAAVGGVAGAISLGALAVRAVSRRQLSTRGHRQGPRPGTPSPPLSGLASGGTARNLVAFLAPGCAGCEGLRSALSTYHQSDVVVHLVELDDDSAETFAAFGVVAPPFLVTVGADGLIGRSGPARCLGDVERLLAARPG